MSGLESGLERRFRTGVHRAGGLAVKVTAASMRGVPDRLVLHGGRTYLVELKRDGETLSPAQRDWHARAARRGVKVTVLRGAAEIDQWVQALTGAENNHESQPLRSSENRRGVAPHP